MNDFLHSLRNGQADKQRAPKTRKTYDNSYQYNNAPRYHSYSNGYQNPRNPNMKRQPIPPGPMGNQLPPEDPGITLLADAIENLTHHVEILIKNQEYMSSIQERTADIIERQALPSSISSATCTWTQSRPVNQIPPPRTSRMTTLKKPLMLGCSPENPWNHHLPRQPLFPLNLPIPPAPPVMTQT